MTSDFPESAARRLRIVIPGGSGQVGRMLAARLQQSGHQVTVLTRAPYGAPWLTVYWDAQTVGPWVETLDGADVVIHLTGHTINSRPTEANRRLIYETRIGPTRLLGAVIAGLAHPPRLWMNASAATLYERRRDAAGVDVANGENAPVASGGDVLGGRPWSPLRGFMQRTVRDWEAAFFSQPTPATRKVALRSAVTFSPESGNVFAVLSTLVRLGLGGSAGSGRQFVPWIHEQDYARAVEFLIAHEELEGPFNLSAPEPVSNRDLMAGLRDAWGRPNGLWAPALGVWLGAWLAGSNPELVLGSSRSVPQRLQDAGFEFSFPRWPEAAADLVRQWRQRHN